MKRKIALFVTLAFLLSTIAAGITGCQKNDKKSNNENIEEVNVTYWSVFPEGGPNYDKHMAYIKEFEKNNPGIRITHLGTNFWDYFSKLSVAQAGGQEIDIYWHDIVSVKFRAMSKVAADLTNYIKRDKIDLITWTKADIDSCSYKSGIYALPVESDYRVLFYNKDIFKAGGLDPEKPPKTFEQLKEYAAKLTKMETDSKGKKVMTQLGFDPRIGNCQIQQIVWPMGGSFFDSEGNPTLNSPVVVQAIDWWVSICRSYNARALNQFQTAHSDGSGLDTSFAEGVTAMIINENGLAWQLEKDAPGLNYGVAPVPYVSEKTRASWAGGFTIEMSNKSSGAQAEAAWKYIKFLTGEDIQSRFLGEMEFTPANLKAMDNEIKRANDNQKKIIQEFKYGRHVDYCEASQQWGVYLMDAISKAIAKEFDAQQAADKAQQDLLKAIDEYKKTH